MDQDALDNILQFPDIAGIFIGHEPLCGLNGQSGHRHARTGMFCEKMVGQQGNILPPFGERGDLDGQDIEPIEKISPEGALFGLLFQILVGCRQYSDIYRNFFCSPDPQTRFVPAAPAAV